MRTRNLLRRTAASHYLQERGVDRAPATLAKHAVNGDGPIYRLINRIPYYSPDDLDEWVDTMLSAPIRSASQTAKRPEISDCSTHADQAASEQVADYGPEKLTAVRSRAAP